jgi:endoglucanase
MVKMMGLGINLGNTLEAPIEGAWAPAATEKDFDQFKAKGFTNVRIPVRWDNHTEQTPPYAVDEQFMSRVEQVVEWSLARGFVTVMNTHHEDWLDHPDTFAAKLPRLKAIWTQIAARFQSKPEKLLFEIFNEPHLMSIEQLNAMNAVRSKVCRREPNTSKELMNCVLVQAVLPIIRTNNSNRIVILGGLQWMNPTWQTEHPASMKIPSGDPQLMLEVHNYDRTYQ